MQLRGVTASLLLVGALIGTSARADTSSTQAAQVLFEEGRKLMAAGRLGEACPKLAESQKLDPGAGTALNLALCYEKSELFASAWVTYTEAMALADRSGRTEWHKKAKDKANALSPSLSTLTITVPADARKSGLEVTRDGRPVAAAEWGVKVPIDGGEHLVEAKAPGHEAWSSKVSAPKRHGTLHVNVPVLAPSAPTVAAVPVTSEATMGEPASKPVPSDKDNTAASGASAAASSSSSGSGRRTAGIVLGVAGLVAAGAGGYFGFDARSKQEKAEPFCIRDQCREPGLTYYRDANTSADISTIAFIAGGVLLVSGIVLFVTAPSATKKNAARTLDSLLSPLRGAF